MRREEGVQRKGPTNTFPPNNQSYTPTHTSVMSQTHVRQILCTVCMCVWYSVRTCGEQLVCAQEADSQPHDGGLVQVRADAVG